MKRRQVLKNAGHIAMSSTYFYGLQTLLDTCIRANTAQASDRNPELTYVNIQMPGAPPRWMFDQPLNPFNNNGDAVAGKFGTKIRKKGNNYEAFLAGEKVTFGGTDYWLPPVWALNSTHSGAPLAKLLDHSLMIRGIDMEINSHTTNRTRMVRPVASNPSIHGLVADQSSRPMAATGAMACEGTKAFKSESGASIIQVPMSNPIPSLIAPYKGPVTLAEELSFDMKDLIESLDKDAIRRKLSSVGSEKQQMAAYEMFEKNLNDFSKDWKQIYDRYKVIIARAIRANFPDVTNVNPIGKSGDEAYRYSRSANNFVTGAYASKITNNTHIDQMAQAFAFTEFALKKKLSSTISVHTGGASMQALTQVGTLINDQHFVGGVTSVYFTSLKYRALATCLLELTDQLKAQKLFDDTVIHVMSEFSRTPKSSGGGSDHGFNGTSAMIISGMIDQPGLIGNIAKQANSSSMRNRYPGTWGEAAPLFEKPDRNLVNDDIVQTLCEMLEVRKVAVKGESLVKKSGGRATWTRDWKVKNV